MGTELENLCRGVLEKFPAQAPNLPAEGTVVVSAPENACKSLWAEGDIVLQYS